MFSLPPSHSVGNRCPYKNRSIVLNTDQVTHAGTKKGTGISGLTSKRYKRYFRKCRHRQNSKLVRHIDFYPTRDSVKETDIDTNLTTTNLEKSVSSVNSLNSLYRYRTKRLVQCYISRYFLKLAITVR